MQFLHDMKLLHTFCRKMTNNQVSKSACFNQKKTLGEGLFTFSGVKISTTLKFSQYFYYFVKIHSKPPSWHPSCYITKCSDGVTIGRRTGKNEHRL